MDLYKEKSSIIHMQNFAFDFNLCKLSISLPPKKGFDILRHLYLKRGISTVYTKLRSISQDLPMETEELCPNTHKKFSLLKRLQKAGELKLTLNSKEVSL